MDNPGPKGINWESTLEFYLTTDSEGRIPSYQDVADKFGVSKSEVGLRAKNENSDFVSSVGIEPTTNPG
jgi:hypothetical protein